MFEYFQLAIIWLSRKVWLSLPLIVTLAAMIVFMAPANLFRGTVPAPDIALVAIFYWAIFGPAFLPPWAVLVLGLAQDFTTGAPLGFWAVIYLLAYGFSMSQRVFFMGRSGPGVLFGFTVVALLTAIATWVLGSITYARWLPPAQIFLQAPMSALLYFCVSPVYAFIRRMLTTAREAI